jgi:hypothetical protein
MAEALVCEKYRDLARSQNCWQTISERNIRMLCPEMKPDDQFEFCTPLR